MSERYEVVFTLTGRRATSPRFMDYLEDLRGLKVFSFSVNELAGPKQGWIVRVICGSASVRDRVKVVAKGWGWREK